MSPDEYSFVENGLRDLMLTIDSEVNNPIVELRLRLKINNILMEMKTI